MSPTRPYKRHPPLPKIQYRLLSNPKFTPFTFLMTFLNVKYIPFSPCNPEGVAMQKILIVDDSTLFRITLKETLLSRFPSLIILEAQDGEEALRTVPTFLPDLIFMDIRLPDQNGLELTQKIKGLFPDIKVVILTSYDLPEYREAAFAYKADHCASKDLLMSLVDLILQEDPGSRLI
jgi:CheY-like chemotaxis protein